MPLNIVNDTNPFLLSLLLLLLLPPRSSRASSSSLSQLREKGLQVGKPATFNVQFNGAQGHLDARVVAPSGAEDEAALMEVEKGHYAVRFVPKENGTHQVVD